MAVHQQRPLQEAEAPEGVVAAAHRLPTLLAVDACRERRSAAVALGLHSCRKSSYEICCYMYFRNTARAHSKGPKVFTTITAATLPCIITEADVRLLNHADVIGAVADGGSGWILRTGLDEAHNLSRHINTAA